MPVLLRGHRRAIDQQRTDDQRSRSDKSLHNFRLAVRARLLPSVVKYNGTSGLCRLRRRQPGRELAGASLSVRRLDRCMIIAWLECVDGTDRDKIAVEAAGRQP